MLEDIKWEVTEMKNEGYTIANLSDDKIKELKKAEVELSEKFGTDLVLVAWQKEL